MNSTQRAASMAGLLGAAGIMHFLRPAPFDSIVPPLLGDRRLITYASGVAELGCAGLLAVPATRRVGGACTAALMIAVYPANIYAVKKYRHLPTARNIALARLPLQVPLVLTAWRIARGDQTSAPASRRRARGGSRHESRV